MTVIHLDTPSKISKKVAQFFGNYKDEEVELNEKHLSILRTLPTYGDGEDPIRVKEIRNRLDGNESKMNRSTVISKLNELKIAGYIITEMNAYFRKSAEELWGEEKHLSLAGSVGFFLLSLLVFFFGTLYGTRIFTTIGGGSMAFSFFWMVISFRD